MGTNYYFNEHLHLGKSSGGWCFLLHVYPELGIKSLDDMVAVLATTEGSISDEYGRLLSLRQFLEVVTQRLHFDRGRISKAFLRENEAIEGPKGLLRCKIGGNCIGHGAGTWDLIVGEFC